MGGGADPLSAADDSPVAARARFQAANCASLAFKPKLSFRLTGGARRGDHPALKAVVDYPRGRGYANIGKAVVTLPHSAFLEQAHIRTICTRVQFRAHHCPAGSIYGRVGNHPSARRNGQRPRLSALLQPPLARSGLRAARHSRGRRGRPHRLDPGPSPGHPQLGPRHPRLQVHPGNEGWEKGPGGEQPQPLREHVEGKRGTDRSQRQDLRFTSDCQQFLVYQAR